MHLETMIELAALALWIGFWTWLTLCGLPRIARWAYREEMAYYRRLREKREYRTR